MTTLQKIIQKTGESHYEEAVAYGLETIADGVVTLALLLVLGFWCDRRTSSDESNFLELSCVFAMYRPIGASGTPE